MLVTVVTPKGIVTVEVNLYKDQTLRDFVIKVNDKVGRALEYFPKSYQFKETRFEKTQLQKPLNCLHFDKEHAVVYVSDTLAVGDGVVIYLVDRGFFSQSKPGGEVPLDFPVLQSLFGDYHMQDDFETNTIILRPKALDWPDKAVSFNNKLQLTDMLACLFKQNKLPHATAEIIVGNGDLRICNIQRGDLEKLVHPDTTTLAMSASS